MFGNGDEIWIDESKPHIIWLKLMLKNKIIHAVTDLLFL